MLKPRDCNASDVFMFYCCDFQPETLCPKHVLTTTASKASSTCGRSYATMATQLPPIVRDASSPSKYAGSRVNTSQSQRLKVTLSRKSNKSRPQHRQHGFKREVKVPTTLNYDIEGGDVLEPPR